MWSILLGIIGWFVASFFAKPLLDFLNLRNQVHEEIIYTANIGQTSRDTPAHHKGIEALRRLGAKVDAINHTAWWPLRWFLSKNGYDLPMAFKGLMGLSNSLDKHDEGRAIHKNAVQKGLKLPRDFDDEQIDEIRNTRDAQHNNMQQTSRQRKEYRI